MLSGIAHTAVCVPDVEQAVGWYESVLGLRVLSPPYRMEGAALADDMGALVSDPTMTAAIVGLDDSGDRVLEVIEYPAVPGRSRPAVPVLTDHGWTHVGLLCDDIDATRSELEGRGVRFLTPGIARVAGLRTTWFADPFGVVFILMEKGDPDRPYYRQW
jgi:catechol 2,3-dioxygenase-like lactoylglutathione lyase family enzyme